MDYKLLVLDLDDTLLSQDLTISTDNIEAIRAAKEKGLHVVLCSGRPKKSMLKYADILDIHDAEDYIVSYNGAIINQFDGTEVLYKPIEGQVLHRLIDIGRQAGIDVQLYSEDLTVEKYTDRTKHYESLTGFPATLVEDLKNVTSSIKVLYNHIEGSKLENLRLKLVEEFDDRFNIFYSKPFYIEVLNKAVSKGLAVKYLSELLYISRDEVIAVGDGFNDVSMLEYAGMGIAVKNAPEGVKAVADYVTKRDHNSSAIREVYDRFIK